MVATAPGAEGEGPCCGLCTTSGAPTTPGTPSTPTDPATGTSAGLFAWLGSFHLPRRVALVYTPVPADDAAAIHSDAVIVGVWLYYPMVAVLFAMYIYSLVVVEPHLRRVQPYGGGGRVGVEIARIAHRSSTYAWAMRSTTTMAQAQATCQVP